MQYVKSSISSSASLNDVADWIELKTLQEIDTKYKFSLLYRMLDDEGDSAATTFEKADSEHEEVVSQWLGEIGERAANLGDAYPFLVTNSEIKLKDLTSDLNQGQYAYILCLLLSHAKDTDAIDGKKFLNIGKNDPARELFQIISTIAASGYLNGSSVSFGWPRQDKTKFPAALKRVIQLTNDGAKYSSTPHPGAPKRVKDFEIDIVSWIPTNDNLPNKMFLVSQVASGYNWESKPLDNKILASIDCWLERHFSSRFNIATGLFIPFCIIPKHAETVSERLSFLSGNKVFNLIFYRNRIPYYVNQVFKNKLQSTAGIIVERTDDFSKIITWVDEKLASLHQ
ncbi:MAG: hypothetical protein JKY34_04695 [Kordiimonadaceae bacterium]|nr:hypothetical protein [Kordiimonadaceae bacterium]